MRSAICTKSQFGSSLGAGLAINKKNEATDMLVDQDDANVLALLGEALEGILDG